MEVRGHLEIGDEATARGSHGPRYQPLVVVVVALAAGMLVDRYAGPAASPLANINYAEPLAPAWLACCWCLSAARLVLWWFVWRRRHDAAAACLVLLAVAASGTAWHDMRWNLLLPWDGQFLP